ncbi:MAG: gliding motility-associated protein GldE [Bacteroidia bacterium]|nr:gliding motility-associated protein GldE [Bacteroidia bacterium]
MDLTDHTVTFLFNIVLHPVTPGIIYGIIAIVALLFFSAIFSGAEISYFSLSPAEVNALHENPGKNNALIIKLLDAPNKLLATLLIANNFVNIGIVIIYTYIVNSIFDFSAAPILGFAIQVVVITLFILLFGEILPKVYATQHTLKFASFVALPVYISEKIFYPLSALLINSTSVINKKIAGKKPNISIGELSHALELTSGELTEEKEILEGIVKFGNIDVKEIMKSRVDVMSVDIGTDSAQLLSLIVDTGYSRIPVYEETSDNIKGILYVKDMLPYIYKNESFQWQHLLRPPYFVPETKKINDLLQEFQQKKIHLAVVIDEYGGVSGIVTMEDILEEIVGEINDEYDNEENNYIKLDEHTYIFEGKTLLNDLCKILHCEDNEFDEVKGSADTIAGVLLELTGEIPQKNEKVIYKNYTFLVTSADNRRIKKVKITVKKQTLI